jgi:hypothetical protein
MGVRFPGFGNNTIVTAVLGTNVETIAATSTLLNISIDFSQVMILWYVMFTPGVSSTGTTMRLRRGTAITGTQLNVNGVFPVTAGNVTISSGCYIDTPGAVAGQQYSVSLLTQAATANGTITDACIIAFAL